MDMDNNAYYGAHPSLDISKFSPQGRALEMELRKMEGQNAPSGQILQKLDASMGMAPMHELLALRQMHTRQMQKMGGLGALAGMMPGMKKAKQAMESSGMDDRVLLRMDAIIGSMTLAERKNPDLLNASRRRRIAAGSGTKVEDVNRIIKQYRDMATMMKKMRKMGAQGLARSGFPGLMPR